MLMPDRSSALGSRLALALLFLLVFMALGAKAQPPGLSQRLDAVLERAVEQGQTVGAVVLVAHQGKVVYHRAIGFADQEAGQVMSEDNLFRLASMTKPVVTAAALALAESGKLSLETPVSSYLPWFTPTLPNGHPTLISVRQLLNQTSGLTYGFSQPPGGTMSLAGVSDGLDDPGISMEENLRRLATVPLSYTPGTAWGYSLATDVLGAVVARVGKASLPRVIKNLITGPLNMADTAFYAQDPKRLAKAYVYAQGQARPMAERELVPNPKGITVFQPSRATNPRAYASGGAGLVGTAGDYLKFLEALRQDGGQVLKPASAQAMRQNQVDSLKPALEPGWVFGYGVAVLADPKATGTPLPAGCWCWGGAYGTDFVVDQKNGISLVLMTNTAPGPGWTLAVDIRRAVYQ